MRITLAKNATTDPEEARAAANRLLARLAPITNDVNGAAS